MEIFDLIVFTCISFGSVYTHLNRFHRTTQLDLIIFGVEKLVGERDLNQCCGF